MSRATVGDNSLRLSGEMGDNWRRDWGNARWASDGTSSSNLFHKIRTCNIFIITTIMSCNFYVPLSGCLYKSSIVIQHVFFLNTDESFYRPLSGSRKPEVGVFIGSDETEHHIDLDKTFSPVTEETMVLSIQNWNNIQARLRTAMRNSDWRYTA